MAVLRQAKLGIAYRPSEIQALASNIYILHRKIVYDNITLSKFCRTSSILQKFRTEFVDLPSKSGFSPKLYTRFAVWNKAFLMMVMACASVISRACTFSSRIWRWQCQWNTCPNSGNPYRMEGRSRLNRAQVVRFRPEVCVRYQQGGAALGMTIQET